MENNSEKIQARAAINRLIKIGKLSRGECVFLGKDRGECNGRIEAHHYLGYEDLTPIVWVCSKHHHQLTNEYQKMVREDQRRLHDAKRK